MTNLVEIFLIVCALIVSAAVVVGFLIVRSNIYKFMLKNPRTND